MNQLSDQFYSTAFGTPYPFIGPLDSFTQRLVDASVTTSAPGDAVVLTDYNATNGHFRVVTTGDNPVVIVSLADGVHRTVFGAYSVIEVVTTLGQVSLCFLTDSPPPSVTGMSYEFVPKVVSYGSPELLTAVYTGTTEIVAPGGIMTLVAGANMNFTVNIDAAGNAQVTINAEFDAALPCAEAGIVNKVVDIVSINGEFPDANGNFSLCGKGIWLVEKPPGSMNKLQFRTIGAPCCDCPDYVTTFENMRVIAQDLKVVWVKLREAQSAYQQMLAYVRFLLQAPIVGAVLPGETDRIATP